MLFALFGGFAQIQANSIPDGVLPKNKRQVAGTGATTSTSTPTMSSTDSSSAETTTTSPTQTSTATPTSSDTPTTTTSETSSASPLTTSQSVASNTVVATTSQLTTTDSAGSTVTSNVVQSSTVTAGSSKTTSSSEIVVVGSSTYNLHTLSSTITVSSALVASETIPTTIISVYTSDGVVYSTGISTNAVVPTTTGYAVSTISPSLQDSSSSGNGLSSSSQKIIGGVVGGVGGAILLGGLAVVAWRLWGKKRRQRVPQDDFLGSQDDSIVKEARDSGLDRYHQPVGGPVNTASNF